MNLQMIGQLDRLLSDKMASMHEPYSCDKVLAWCERQGIGFFSELYDCLQFFDKSKNVLMRVRYRGIHTKLSDLFFLVPLDLAHKALLFGGMPD